MESKILLQPCSLEKDKNKKKKSRKRGTTELEPRDNLRRRSCSTGEEKKKKKQKKETLTDAPEPEPELSLFSRGLVRCSEKARKKNSKYGSPPESLITTVSKTSIDTTSITIITPPEDPNDHIHLYLCIQTGLHALSWFKIDPTDTTLEAPKPKSSSSNNYNDNDNSKGKLKKKKPILLRRPISHMPPTTPYGFCAIPHSSSCLAKGKRKKNKKLVYAVGGSIDVRGRSSKAFVCDFASTKPVWKELPQMPSPMHICMGVASPLDGHVYAFGPMLREAPAIHFKYAGLVFDPSLPSWKPCPPPFTKNHPNSYPINDYALAKTENRTELCVFTCSTRAHSFNLAAAQWDRSLYAPVPADSLDVDSSSVGVGHLIFKFHDRKLYAFDTTSPKPSFKPVPGLDNKLPKCWEAHGGGDMVYLGKGKLCIIWSSIPKKPPRGTVSIACLMFWVGMCNRRNRLRAVIDRCERFVAHGLQLCDVVAL